MKLRIAKLCFLLFLFMIQSKQIQQLTYIVCRIFHIPMYTIAHFEGMGARKYLRIHKKDTDLFLALTFQSLEVSFG